MDPQVSSDRLIRNFLGPAPEPLEQAEMTAPDMGVSEIWHAPK